MQKEDLQELVRKYLNNTATPEEVAQLSDWYKKNNAGETEWMADSADEEQRLKNEMLAFINERIEIKKTSRVLRLWPRIAAAASVILCLTIGGYFLLRKQAPVETAQNKPLKNDVLPGGNKAYLTLANGERIILTGAANGRIAQQPGVIVTKTADGQLVYETAKTELQSPTAELKYNTIETPKGGQYQVILPDGSHVWLNAASSLKYPTAFAGNERKVELTGEAYFEVVHNASQPFRVATNGQIVEDIGTHFNINSYADEPATLTTLLEGSVKVNNNTILKPGEQAILFQTGNVMVKEVNTAEFVAWKNGLFQFDNASLEMVMRQLSRWYDVTIDYEGKIPARTFTGKIHRDVNASEALEILKFTRVKFKIEGKTIIVTP